ncbi:MAG: Flp family type IVb pilin [Gemmataceae bacterium]
MLARFVRTAVAFLKEERGPTAVEYAVMLAMIILTCFAAISAIGQQANSKFNNVALQGVK